MKYSYALLLVIPLALACTRMEYDTSDGVNHELTLFERQLTVPVDITVSTPISKSVAATSSSSLSCAGKDVPIEALNSFTLRSLTPATPSGQTTRWSQ